MTVSKKPPKYAESIVALMEMMECGNIDKPKKQKEKQIGYRKIRMP